MARMTHEQLTELRTEAKGRRMVQGERTGQSFFNVLYAHHPEIANAIRATPLDPFYDGAKLPALYDWLTT